MLACQIAMPLGTRRFPKPLQRRSRRPFVASGQSGPYRLPRAIQEQLEKSLKDFRNAEASFALAVFLGRFWSSPNRLDAPFPIDRRALAHHRDLQLTEAQIRGAIKSLERVGFLDRAIIGKGSKFRMNGDDLHRKPILWQFGAEFAAEFDKANRRTKNTTNDGRRTVAPRHQGAVATSPKHKGPGTIVLMGEIRKKVFEKESAPVVPSPQLEAAILRWRIAFAGTSNSSN